MDAARERVCRNLQDAAVDLAWLRHVYAGGTLGELMADLHGRIMELLEAIMLDEDRLARQQELLARMTALADECGEDD